MALNAEKLNYLQFGVEILQKKKIRIFLIEIKKSKIHSKQKKS